MDAQQPTSLRDTSLFEALRSRRSHRFGLGMEIPAGPLKHRSRHSPVPLSPAQEAALAFAACGITGPAIADLDHSETGGGNILAGQFGRTTASGDAIQTVSLVVINDRGSWLIRPPRELSTPDLRDAIQAGHTGDFESFYERCRIRLGDHRPVPRLEPLFNINCNRSLLHQAGSTYFLPVNELTQLYLNGLLEIFNEHTGVYVLDERANYRPAGLSQFARSRGGHLNDDPVAGKVVTVRHVEQFVNDFINAEQGMMLQNLGLAAAALGLGGYPNFANHEFGWFETLEFRMERMPTAKYLGVNGLVSLGLKLAGRNQELRYPVGLERNGEPLLKCFAPPWFNSMREAVEAVARIKTEQCGDRPAASKWKDPVSVRRNIAPVSSAAIAATVAYCEYLWRRYGRFPVYSPAFRTVLGFQAAHLDADFYDTFYREDALTRKQREAFAKATDPTKPATLTR